MATYAKAKFFSYFLFTNKPGFILSKLLMDLCWFIKMIRNKTDLNICHI